MRKYEEAKKRAKAALAKKGKVNAVVGDEDEEDFWEESDDEDIMGPAGTGKRILFLRTMDQDSDDEIGIHMPPIPDPSWVRPDRHADANTEAIKAAWAEAREQVVSGLSGWAHKTNIRVQNSNKKDLSKFTQVGD